MIQHEKQTETIFRTRFTTYLPKNEHSHHEDSQYECQIC